MWRMQLEVRFQVEEWGVRMCGDRVEARQGGGGIWVVVRCGRLSGSGPWWGSGRGARAGRRRGGGIGAWRGHGTGHRRCNAHFPKLRLVGAVLCRARS